MNENVLGIKIDVDTYQGMKKGVPRILDILNRFNIRATFYLSMGPDASGRAALQLIKNPLFFKKMIKSNAAGLYGFKTALYGTLLPSPMIALSFPEIVKQIISNGHEVQFHAWDHRRWQDELYLKSIEWITEWFEKGINSFKKLTGYMPTSFGAPAWLIDDRVMEIIGKYKFDYLSCTRAKEPFVHEKISVVEIPSDLPCIEEIGIDNAISQITSLLKNGGIHVLPVHAEVEGGIRSNYFIQLLEQIEMMNYSVKTLGEIKDYLFEDIAVRKYKIELLSGRSAPCAV
ncbi:MAG: polysaccharide deacetylase family protein [Proteobacteria bacterium]|nr:polysaccharide deacetylase family protein [Pseudomonadota bacterium]